jgi:hypothetical protein
MTAYDTVDYIGSFVIAECAEGETFGKEDNYIIFNRSIQQ